MDHSASGFRRPARSSGRWMQQARLIFSLAAALILGACSAGMGDLSSLRLSNFALFNGHRPQAVGPGGVILPRDPAALGQASVLEVTLRNAIDLAEQRRFVEASALLAEVRATQPPESDGFKAASCAMAIAALRAGDIGTFRRVARQLDAALGRPVRVDTAYVGVVALSRALAGESVPVNAPPGMHALKARLAEPKADMVARKGAS